MTLADKLNLFGFRFAHTKAGVKLVADPGDDFEFDAERTEQAYNSFLDVLNAGTCYVDYDPSDSRAELNSSVVVYVEAEGARAWHEDDHGWKDDEGRPSGTSSVCKESPFSADED